MNREQSHWHDPKYQPNPYEPKGRRITPFDHAGLRDEMMSERFIDTVTLRKKQISYEIEIDRREAEMSKRANGPSLVEMAGRELRMQMRIQVWGEEDRTTAIAKVPATWEDAFKLGLITVFDNPVINWFVRRSPVRYKEVKASLSVTFPDFKPSVPDQDYVCKVFISRPFKPEWMQSPTPEGR